MASRSLQLQEPLPAYIPVGSRAYQTIHKLLNSKVLSALPTTPSMESVTLSDESDRRSSTASPQAVTRSLPQSQLPGRNHSVYVSCQPACSRWGITSEFLHACRKVVHSYQQQVVTPCCKRLNFAAKACCQTVC